MRRLVAPALAVGLAAGTFAAAPSQDGQRVDADHVVELAIGETTTVNGGTPQGINVGYNEGLTGCSKDPQSYCEYVLVKLTNEYDEDKAKKGRERATANFVLTTATNQISDYDVFWYESDESGALGAQIASSTAFPYGADSTEQAALSVTTTEEVADVWVLVEVVYFSAIEAYNLDIDFNQ